MIDSSEFDSLYDMLNKITVPVTSSRNNRRNFPKHRRLVFGIVKGRFDGINGLSRSSVIYQDIFDEITRIGDKYCNFNYTAIHLNHNVICPPHYDNKNTKQSMIVSFGTYTGCNLILDNVTYDTKYRPITFDGAKILHWNTNDLVGNKYSLVYY